MIKDIKGTNILSLHSREKDVHYHFLDDSTRIKTHGEKINTEHLQYILYLQYF